MSGRAKGGEVRIDKWLWAARFYKTRSMAAAAVEHGQVCLAEQRVKPAHSVRVGDAILVHRGDERIECVVRGLSDVRGPASAAQLLYEETADSRERRVRRSETRRLAREPAASIKGRPSKRDGRELRRLSGKAHAEGDGQG
jgi:ribosome-associated heat shock protein Hsp15